MKYKVGDRAIVRKDLVGGLNYPSPGGLYFAYSMNKFRGKEYEIVAIRGHATYQLSLEEEEDMWVFNDAMLIPASKLRSLICKRNIK